MGSFVDYREWYSLIFIFIRLFSFKVVNVWRGIWLGEGIVGLSL